MKTFTIEKETNNIMIHASAKEADAVPGAERFGNEATLGKLAVNSPADRLVEIWNSLPGAAPAGKFKDRKAAVSRIWKAIQNLRVVVPVTPHTTDGAPAAAPAKDDASRVKKTPAAATKKGIREGSKTETILGLMQQPGGSTLKAIMEATNWQAHSVRGFISGTLGKKMGLKFVSTRGENGERRYSMKHLS